MKAGDRITWDDLALLIGAESLKNYRIRIVKQFGIYSLKDHYNYLRTISEAAEVQLNQHGLSLRGGLHGRGTGQYFILLEILDKN